MAFHKQLYSAVFPKALMNFTKLSYIYDKENDLWTILLWQLSPWNALDLLTLEKCTKIYKKEVCKQNVKSAKTEYSFLLKFFIWFPYNHFQGLFF